MPIYRIENSKAVKLSVEQPDKEKDIQKLFEKNLLTILGVDFLATEYATSEEGRIDTLGIDRNGSPVIVEYKKNQNNNVINQALSYLVWLKDHKADFEILCRDKNINIEFDWSSPRVICVAQNYSKFDLKILEEYKTKIELYKYELYEDNILLVELANQKSEEENISDNKVKKDYTIENHLENCSEEIKRLFKKLREQILSIDNDINEVPKAKYIAYKLTKNFVDVTLKRDTIKVFINIKSGDLEDTFGIARDMKEIGHWGNGDYEIIIRDEEGLNKLFELIKQSYRYNK